MWHKGEDTTLVWTCEEDGTGQCSVEGMEDEGGRAVGRLEQT